MVLARGRQHRLLGLSALLLVLVLPARAGAAEDERGFFDPLVTLDPGISRELSFVVDHIRADGERLTSMSAKLQYPVLPWLQFSIEMPVLVPDGPTEDPTIGAGDLVLTGQAALLTSRDGRSELAAGVELTLPTGSVSLLAGSTAVRPFVTGAIKLGPLGLIANVSHLWVVAGPVADVQLFQANSALGYPLLPWITPFVELNLIKPVQGLADLRPQVYALPGLELFLPWSLSLSAGVQLPLTSARLFEQRVLGLLKWQF